MTLSSSTASTKGELEIKFHTEPDSIVSVQAVDKSSIFFNTDNSIEKIDIIKAMERTPKAAEISNYNKNYIINLKLSPESWEECTAEENEVLDKVNKPTLVIRSIPGGAIYRRNHEDGFLSEANPETRDHFPETWILETLETDEEGFKSIIKQVPDSLTTWLFTAFSINKGFGFAIAEPQELVVSKEFFIEMNLPTSIKVGEVTMLEIIIFNYVQTGNSLDVTLNVDSIDSDARSESKKQFELIEFVDISLNCKIRQLPGDSQTETIRVPHRSGLRRKFYIRPLVTGLMKINVGISAKDGQKMHVDKTVREIKVENEGVSYYVTLVKEFKLNETHPSDFLNFPFNAQDIKKESVEFSAVVEGHVMGSMKDSKDSEL